MNIRTFFMAPADHKNKASKQRVRNYLDAVKGAQRLSLNFRFKKNETAPANRCLQYN